MILGPYLIDVFPSAFERWVVNTLPWPKLHELRDMSDIMWNTAKEIVDTTKRGLQDEKAISSKPDSGNNIMKILSTFIFNSRDVTYLPIAPCYSQGKHGSLGGGQDDRRRDHPSDSVRDTSFRWSLTHRN